MYAVVKVVALLMSVAIAASGCQSEGEQSLSDAISNADSEVFIDPDGSVNVNVTEADFRRDFLSLPADQKVLLCEWFWSLSEDEYDAEMYAAGYGEAQVIASWNALVEVC